MRIGSLVSLLGLGLLGGCASNWTADFGEQCTDANKVPYYVDGDNDLWGAEGDYEMLCSAAGDYQVRNNRDCDDTNPEITGRVGSICPSDMVTQGSGTPGEDDYVHTDVQFTGVVVGDNEFLVVHDATEVVWAAAAEDACGPYGWGGQLATFEQDINLIEVLDKVLEPKEDPLTDVVNFAGYVGYDPAFGEWGHNEWDGTAWVWNEDDTGMTVQSSRFCSPGDYADDLGFLALVMQGSSASWCLGTPDEAIVAPATDPLYEKRLGHFICERPKPDPADFAVHPDAVAD